MPIDWSQVGGAPPPTGAIDWNTVSQLALPSKAAIAAQIANDPISQGAQAFPNQPSDALGGVSQAAFDELRALGHNLVKPVHGVAQLVQNAVAAGASALPDNAVSRAVIDSAAKDNAAQQQWEQQYQRAVPNNAASYAGATIGAALPFFANSVTGAFQKAGDAVAGLVPSTAPAIVPNIASGVAQGVLASATAPVDSGTDYWTQRARQAGIGAATGGSLPLLGAAASGIKNAAAPFTNPQSVVAQALTRWGVTPQGIAAGEIVPGSLPTTAQAVANPDIVAAEKTIAGNPNFKPLFDARNIANNDARWAVINDIAKTPQELDTAIAARRAATSPVQEALLNNGAPVPVASIIDQLDTLANSPLGMRPAIAGAANDIKAQIGQFATKDANGNLTIGPAHLDAIRQNVKDFLAKYAPNGAVGSQQQAAFEPVRGAIVDAIEGANPGYRNYLAQYAQLSQPINTMEAGQSIVDNLGHRAANASGDSALSLGGINAQIKKALDSQYGIAPSAQAGLKAIQDDLQRASISNSVRVPGSDTNYNVQAPNWLGRVLYGQNYEGSKTLTGLGGAVGGGLGWATGGLYGAGTGAATGAYAGKLLADLASKRVNSALADALLNPDVARQILLTQSSPQQSQLVQQLLARIPQAGLVMSNTASRVPLQVPVTP